MDFDARFPASIGVTGQEIDETTFTEKWKRDIFDLGGRTIEKYRRSGKERFIAAFGGASGSGKSTAAKTLEHLLRSENIPATAVSQDGYHFTKEYLASTFDEKGKPLAKHKGSGDTFDVSAMKRDLERFVGGEDFAFPEYSRKTHEPIPNAVPVTGPAPLIFEGLWLLYDRKPWSELLALYDLTVFFMRVPKPDFFLE